MTTRTVGLSEDLQAYVLAHSAPQDQITLDLAKETRASLGSLAGMQVAPEQSALLNLLAKLVGARLAVEVGTFTGLSSLAIARGMPADGRLICFDISEEYTSIARRYWARAGVQDRIELRIGPAAQMLPLLPDEPHLDLAFIDADKTGYPVYWAELVPRMRPGGVIVVDNVLQHGRVLDPPPDNASVQAIVKFNDDILADDRVEVVMLPIADGVTVARRR
jgi:caffeoyl-CoA O-methyltransferase